MTVKQQRRAGWGARLALASALTCLAPLGILIGLAPAGAAYAEPASHLADAETSGMNLTAVQQQKLSALEAASRAQSGVLFGQLQQIRGKLSDLYRKYDLDAAAAARLNQDLNHVQGQLLDQRLSDQQQLRRILTPDQFAQLQSSIQRRRHDNDRGPGGAERGRHDRAWSPQ